MNRPAENEPVRPSVTAVSDRPPTLAEEIANSVSHGIGLLAAIAWAPILIVNAVGVGDAGFIVGSSIFAATSIALYLASTLYHAARGGRVKRIFRKLDHVAIYLLIAGTYTPFTIGILRGAWGWTLFGLVWGVALAGIALKMSGTLIRHPRWSTALYLVLGWIVVVAVKPVLTHVPVEGLAWLVAGGAAYSIGVLFFNATRVRYSHFVWHLFVMLGTGCHTIAVFGYAAR